MLHDIQKQPKITSIAVDFGLVFIALNCFTSLRESFTFKVKEKSKSNLEMRIYYLIVDFYADSCVASQLIEVQAIQKPLFPFPFQLPVLTTNNISIVAV